MLVELSIRDLVLIDRLRLDFAGGLSALTGETGAGKSILLDGLGLAIGGRSDSSLIRQGAERASVAAGFALSPDHPARRLVREHDLPDEEVLVLRRMIGRDGRSRALVNDQNASVGLVRRIGETLIEIHGQFATQGLLNPQTHAALVDAYGGLAATRAKVAATWDDLRNALRRAEEERARVAAARAEEAFLIHAVEELDQLAPQEGEEAQLAEARSMAQNRERLAEAIGLAAEGLTGDHGAEAALAGAARALGRVADKAGQRLEPVIGAIDRALAEAEEASTLLAALTADLEIDSGAAERAEERLFALRAVARKHNVEVEELPTLRVEFGERLALIRDSAGRLGELDRAAAAHETAFREAAEKLSAARLEAAARLDEAVARELPPLKLEKARFRTIIERLPAGEWSPSGIDRISFAVATNPGAAPGPLARIASGGELARFMLALRVVLAATGSVPTLVFDEVDSGISGAVADAVGERLARLGRDLQVLVVTHSPQVAARAQAHLRVEKASEDGVARTRVAPLHAAERREEIARMLSGAVVTAEARAAADSLLEGAP